MLHSFTKLFSGKNTSGRYKPEGITISEGEDEKAWKAWMALSDEEKARTGIMAKKKAGLGCDSFFRRQN